MSEFERIEGQLNNDHGSRRAMTFGDMAPSINGLVFDAWSGGDLDEMLMVVNITDCPPVDRHFLLLSIVTKSYQARHKGSRYRDIALEYSKLHLLEWPRLWRPLLASSAIGEPGDEDYMPPEEELPNVPTFKLRAKLLMEDRSYKDAIAVIVEASNYPFPNYVQDDLKKLLDKIRVDTT